MQWFTWEPSVWIRFYSFYSKSSNLIHSNKKLGTGLLNVVISQRFFLVWRFQHTDKSLYGFHVNLWIYPVQEQHFKHFAHHRTQNLHTRELWEISKSPHTRWIPRFQTLNTVKSSHIRKLLNFSKSLQTTPQSSHTSELWKLSYGFLREKMIFPVIEQ